MSWTLLIAVVIALGVALGAALVRRHELARMRTNLRERERAQRAGSARAELQHPIVDLSRCLGCGACVRACPEDGVLELVHGQAMVVAGARCRGHANCERECPVDAIRVTLADAATRDDVPALSDELEAIGAPGIFLAGEVTARALIKTAIEQGTAVANAVARRVPRDGGATGRPDGLLDLAIVGAGPAGLACALEARRLGLELVVLDRESGVGGTVARYPRKKLVVTRPVELPIHGALAKTSYEKEELVELWAGIARDARLPIACGETFEGVERAPDGTLVVRSTSGATRARCVVLAVGRRGTPRRLGVPGEDLPHVVSALLDARSHANRRSIVVGGGESAVEAALALAEQDGADVTLVHRGEGLVRVSPAHERRVDEAARTGRLRVSLRTTVRAIHRGHVEIEVAADGAPSVTPSGADAQSFEWAAASSAGAPALVEGRSAAPLVAGGGHATATAPGSSAHGEAGFAHEDAGGAHAVLATPRHTPLARSVLACDDVFVMIGGEAPLPLLQRCGVSFDPALRPASEPIAEQGTGLVRALAIGFVLALATLAFALSFAEYYLLPRESRPEHELHTALRPGQGFGLALGITSAALVVANLLYLLRRERKLGFTFGTLRTWMTTHVATGIAALLVAVLHGGLDARDTVGGHALWALAFLLGTGAIGRYFYAYVPRAANGRELELTEVRRALREASNDVDHRRREAFERAASRVRALAERRQWSDTFLGRALALVRGEREFAREIQRLRADARGAELDPRTVDELASLARRAHRAALAAAHFEDLRGLLSTWRWFHRWMAALFVVLLVLHVVYALSHGSPSLRGSVS